jgi:hypothetical protein
MALDKPLVREGGKTKRRAPATASTGTADAGRLVAANSAGKLDETFLPAGIGANTVTAAASEALSAGSFVNLHEASGVFSARLADNSNGRPAHGFVAAAVASSATATVYPLGVTNSGLSGLTLGADYWLGAAGGVISTPLDETDANNAGCLSQYLGVAKSDTELVSVRDDPVTL